LKIRSLRHDRARVPRATPAADIAELTAKAEAEDAEGSDPRALPAGIARRQALKAKPDAAGARLEAEARIQAEAERPAYENKKAAYDAKKGGRGRPPKPPDGTPPAERQINLTDPDSQLMRKSEAYEYRQAYNAQAVVCAEGSQLILATNMATTPRDQPTPACPTDQVRGLKAHGAGSSRPPSWRWNTRSACRGQSSPMPALPAAKRWPNWRPRKSSRWLPLPRPSRTGPMISARRIREPWRLAMQAKLKSEDGKSRDKKRKQTLEPVFGIIRSAIGFTRFHLRSREKVATEWLVVALAYNCRRLSRLQAA
jgi:hypothetical protein